MCLSFPNKKEHFTRLCGSAGARLLAVIVPCGCFHCNDALIYTSKKFFCFFFLHLQTFQLLMSYLCLGFFSDIVLLFLLLLLLSLLFKDNFPGHASVTTALKAQTHKAVGDILPGEIRP